MKRRFFPARPGPWRHRFVQIAREMDASAAAPAAPGLGLRARPRPTATAPFAGRGAVPAAA